MGCTRAGISSPADPYITPLRVGTQQIFVQVVSTDSAKEQGLSGREGLTDKQGMLFIFDGNDLARPGFWMKDMKFDLDFIWIKNHAVIGITPNVPHPARVDANLPVYYPPEDVDAVLEVNAGWTATHNIKVGDQINL